MIIKNLNFIIDKLKNSNDDNERSEQVKLLFETLLKYGNINDKGGVAYTLSSLYDGIILNADNIVIDDSKQDILSIIFVGVLKFTIKSSCNKKNFEIEYSCNQDLAKKHLTQIINGKIQVENLNSDGYIVLSYNTQEKNSSQNITGGLLFDPNGFGCELRESISQYNYHLGYFSTKLNCVRKDINTRKETTKIILHDQEISVKNYAYDFEKDDFIMPYIRKSLVDPDPNSFQYITGTTANLIEKKSQDNNLRNNNIKNLNFIIDKLKKSRDDTERLQQVKFLFETLLKYGNINDKGGVAYTLSSLYGNIILDAYDIKIEDNNQDKLSISIIGYNLELKITSFCNKNNFVIEYSHSNQDLVSDRISQIINGKIQVENLNSDGYIVLSYDIFEKNSKQNISGGLLFDPNGFGCELRESIRQYNYHLGGFFSTKLNCVRKDINTRKETTKIILLDQEISVKNYAYDFEKDDFIMPYIRSTLIAVNPAEDKDKINESYHQVFSEYIERIKTQYSSENNNIKK